jgi:hypothetical protein
MAGDAFSLIPPLNGFAKISAGFEVGLLRGHRAVRCADTPDGPLYWRLSRILSVHAALGSVLNEPAPVVEFADLRLLSCDRLVMRGPSDLDNCHAGTEITLAF